MINQKNSKMHFKTRQEEIVISRSTLPVIRGGFSNIIFLLLLIALVLVNQIMNSFNISLILRIMLFIIISAAAFKVFSHSISRLSIENEKKLVIVGSLYESTFDFSEIKLIKIFGIPSSMTIFIMIKKTTSKLPIFYFFVAASTNYGSYETTRLKIISLLKNLIRY